MAYLRPFTSPTKRVDLLCPRCPDETRTYEVALRCTNCLTEFVGRFTWSHPVSRGPCPGCGCSNVLVKR